MLPMRIQPRWPPGPWPCPQVSVLAIITEFIGAVALGSQVMGTIKNYIIDLNRFQGTSSVLTLVMACAEFSSAF